MSLFGRFGAALGIGAARVELAVAPPQVHRGETVTGTVTLRAGRCPQKVRTLTADLYEYWITGHGKNRSYNQRRHGRVVLAEYVPIEPGLSRDFAFEFRMPDDARCSRRREGWEVRCAAHIPWSVDARSSVPLRVLPHPEILAVQRAARDGLGLMPLTWDGSQSVVMYDFRAPQHLRHLLDGVAFRLWMADGVLAGEMILNKQERRMTDVLRAMVGGDREVIPLEIARSELLTKRGSPNPSGAYPYLKAMLEGLGAALPPLPGETRMGGMSG